MTPLAVTLVLISALLHGVRDLFTKSSDDKQIFMWLFVLAEVIIISPIFLWSVTNHGLPWSMFSLIFVGCLIHAIYTFLLTKSYQHGDLSHVYPIIRSAPALILVIAVTMFNEQVSTIGVTGIILVVCGAYLINLKGTSLKHILEPIKAIPTEHATQYAVLTMLAVTAYSLFDKQIINWVQPVQYIFFIDVFIFFALTPYIILRKKTQAIVNEWQKNTWPILINGTIAFVGYLLILYAFKIANVSYVTGLRQVSIVIAVLLGGHILREAHKNIRLTAAAIIFAGGVFIAIA